MKRMIGLDYGSKKIGIASSDEGGRLAFPKTTIRSENDPAGRIKKICEEENAAGIVLGESYALDGKPNPVLTEILEFKKKLEDEIGLPVYLEKEFLTSVEARRYEDRKEADASAAALILQRFLDKKNA